VRGIVEAARLEDESRVKTTVFLKDMNDFGTMMKFTRAIFMSTLPGSTGQVSRLPKDALVEIEVSRHAMHSSLPQGSFFTVGC